MDSWTSDQPDLWGFLSLFPPGAAVAAFPRFFSFLVARFFCWPICRQEVQEVKMSRGVSVSYRRAEEDRGVAPVFVFLSSVFCVFLCVSCSCCWHSVLQLVFFFFPWKRWISAFMVGFLFVTALSSLVVWVVAFLLCVFLRTWVQQQRLNLEKQEQQRLREASQQ